MPPELLSKCKPLHCELCNCHATSPLQAKLHYEGKTHDKHVRNFYLNWSGNSNKKIPQKIHSCEKKSKSNLVRIFLLRSAAQVVTRSLSSSVCSSPFLILKFSFSLKPNMLSKLLTIVLGVIFVCDEHY